MKWFFYRSGLLLFLFSHARLVSLYNGNPFSLSLPEFGMWSGADNQVAWKFGYEWDATFSKRLKIKKPTPLHDRIKHYTSYKHFAVFTFNIIDRLELYGKLGSMQFDLKARPLPSIRLDQKTKDTFSWGIGGRAILIYWEEAILGINAWYNRAKLRWKEIKQNGESLSNLRGTSTYNEWQVGLSVSREMGAFSPYIGLAYASLKNVFSNFNQGGFLMSLPRTIRIKNRQPFFLVFGVGLAGKKAFALNAEVRLIGERALSLSFELRF